MVSCLYSSSLPADEQSPKLVLSGVKGDAAENIKRSIDLTRYKCSDSEWQLSRLKKQIQKQATTALQALGYYNSSVMTSLNADTGCWEIKLDVDAGKQVVIRDLIITIQGELGTLPAVKKFLLDPPIKKGWYLNHDDYKKARTEIEVLAARFGFNSGQFTKRRLEINTDTNTADVELQFESGPRAMFRSINIDQNTYTDELVQQYIMLMPNTPYDSQLLIKQQQTLNGSGYFSSVDIDTSSNDGATGQVDINISLEPVKKHAYRFGIGASTDVGPRISFTYKNRRVNRRGHDFSFDSSFSPVRSEITTGYGIPMGNNGNDRLDFQAGFLTEDTDTSELESFKMAALYTHLNSHDWITTSFIEYLSEDFKTADSERLSTFLLPGFKLQKTVVKNSLFPRRGWRMNASLRLGSESLLSSTDIIHFEGGFKFILPVSKARLLVRTDLGASEMDDFEKVPPSLRFFAGGDSSVRGFDYKSLGPTNAVGEVIGGKYLLTSSVEFEYPLSKQWGLAAFADTGNAFNDLNDYELATGIGIGIRWHSPIGPIRLDVAQDVDRQENPRLHLSMGLDL